MERVVILLTHFALTFTLEMSVGPGTGSEMWEVTPAQWELYKPGSDDCGLSPWALVKEIRQGLTQHLESSPTHYAILP